MSGLSELSSLSLSIVMCLRFFVGLCGSVVSLSVYMRSCLCASRVFRAAASARVPMSLAGICGSGCVCVCMCVCVGVCMAVRMRARVSVVTPIHPHARTYTNTCPQHVDTLCVVCVCVCMCARAGA